MELNFLSATFWINFINISFIVCYQRWKKLLKNFKSSKELSKLIISLFCFEVLNCCNKSIINVFFDDKTYCLKSARALVYTLHYLNYLFHVFLTSYWTYNPEATNNPTYFNKYTNSMQFRRNFHCKVFWALVWSCLEIFQFYLLSNGETFFNSCVYSFTTQIFHKKDYLCKIIYYKYLVPTYLIFQVFLL